MALGLLLTLSPRPASASILGEENAQLAAIVGNQLKELEELRTMITWLRTSATSINETLALARRAAEIVRQIRNYTPKQLLLDARRGLYRAMPELEALEGEISAGIGNGLAISQGHGAFFAHSDHHEPWASEMGRSLFSLGYRGLARDIAPDDNPSPSLVERLLAEHYVAAGEATQVALRRSALGVLERKVESFVADTEAKDRVDLRMSAVGLEMGLETASNTGDLAHAKRLEVAKEEAWRRKEVEFNQRLGRSLSEEAGSMFRPAWMEKN